MAYSEGLADRIRDALEGRPGLVERKMFGGVAWMINGNMAVGVMGEDLMVRLTHEEVERALSEDGVEPMEFTGRRMRGFVIVESSAIVDDHDLGRWVDVGAGFAESLPVKT